MHPIPGCRYTLHSSTPTHTPHLWVQIHLLTNIPPAPFFCANTPSSTLLHLQHPSLGADTPCHQHSQSSSVPADTPCNTYTRRPHPWDPIPIKTPPSSCLCADTPCSSSTPLHDHPREQGSTPSPSPPLPCSIPGSRYYPLPSPTSLLQPPRGSSPTPARAEDGGRCRAVPGRAEAAADKGGALPRCRGSWTRRAPTARAAAVPAPAPAAAAWPDRPDRRPHRGGSAELGCARLHPRRLGRARLSSARLDKAGLGWLGFG